jgi:hypothetical protein
MNTYIINEHIRLIDCRARRLYVNAPINYPNSVPFLQIS